MCFSESTGQKLSNKVWTNLIQKSESDESMTKAWLTMRKPQENHSMWKEPDTSTTNVWGNPHFILIGWLTITPFQMLNFYQLLHSKIGLAIIKVQKAPLHPFPKSCGPLTQSLSWL